MTYFKATVTSYSIPMLLVVCNGTITAYEHFGSWESLAPLEEWKDICDVYPISKEQFRRELVRLRMR